MKRFFPIAFLLSPLISVNGLAQQINWRLSTPSQDAIHQQLNWQAVDNHSTDKTSHISNDVPAPSWRLVPVEEEVRVTTVEALQQPKDSKSNTTQPNSTIPNATEDDPTAGGVRIASPYLGGGVPTAYTLTSGDFFIAGTAGTQGKLRDNVDGSFNMGFGLGNPYSIGSIEIDLNFGSTKNFASNGGLDASIAKVIVTEPRFELSVGGGYLQFFSYGTEGLDTPNGYGVATLSTVLNYGNSDFPQIMQISAGIGGNTFSYLDPVTFTGPEIGYFGSIGVELTPQFGVSLGWSGRGGNISLSYIPFPREIPLSINLLASDIANTSPYGTIGLLTVAWGGNFYRDFGYNYGK